MRKGKARIPLQPSAYGSNISLAAARKVAAAAARAATRMQIDVVIAVVDTGGHLLYLERFDMAQFGSVDVAIHKARCSVAFKRPTKVFEDVITNGRTVLLTLDGVIALEGGVPIMKDGRIIGGIGVSGATSQQDGQAAMAGAGVMGRPG
jgi:uncharacterized protein GlcG (DUF336 family)